MNTKIFRKNTTGMAAVVDTETGSAIWLDTGAKIYNKVDVSDGTWTEQTLVPAVGGDVETVTSFGGGVISSRTL